MAASAGFTAGAGVCVFTKNDIETLTGGGGGLTNTGIDLNVFFVFSVSRLVFLLIWGVPEGLHFLSVLKYCGDGWRTGWKRREGLE